MGNTAIMCSVHGPAEGRRGGESGGGSTGAIVEVDVNIAGFAGIDRKRRAGGSDRYVSTLSFHYDRSCPQWLSLLLDTNRYDADNRPE